MSRPRPMDTSGVCLAFLFDENTKGLWSNSIIDLLIHDGNHRRHIIGRGGKVCIQTGPRLAAARNEAVSDFLADPRLGAWLWFVDTDMVFAPDTLDRLLGFADPQTRPVVGALCFSGGRNVTMRPTLYQFTDEYRVAPWAIWPEGQPVQVDATGCGCLLIHRSVLTGPKAPRFETRNWGGHEVSEDIAFCRQLKDADIPVWVHTGVGTGHIKGIALDEHLYDATRR